MDYDDAYDVDSSGSVSHSKKTSANSHSNVTKHNKFGGSTIICSWEASCIVDIVAHVPMTWDIGTGTM